MIELMLFYLYCDCLPPRFDLKNSYEQENQIEENKLKSFIEFISKFNELKQLNSLLQSYLNNFSFKISKLN